MQQQTPATPAAPIADQRFSSVPSELCCMGCRKMFSLEGHRIALASSLFNAKNPSCLKKRTWGNPHRTNRLFSGRTTVPHSSTTLHLGATVYDSYHLSSVSTSTTASSTLGWHVHDEEYYSSLPQQQAPESAAAPTAGTVATAENNSSPQPSPQLSPRLPADAAPGLGTPETCSLGTADSAQQTGRGVAQQVQATPPPVSPNKETDDNDTAEAITPPVTDSPRKQSAGLSAPSSGPASLIPPSGGFGETTPKLSPRKTTSGSPTRSGRRKSSRSSSGSRVKIDMNYTRLAINHVLSQAVEAENASASLGIRPGSSSASLGNGSAAGIDYPLCVRCWKSKLVAAKREVDLLQQEANAMRMFLDPSLEALCISLPPEHSEGRRRSSASTEADTKISLNKADKELLTHQAADLEAALKEEAFLTEELRELESELAVEREHCDHSQSELAVLEAEEDTVSALLNDVLAAEWMWHHEEDSKAKTMSRLSDELYLRGQQFHSLSHLFQLNVRTSIATIRGLRVGRLPPPGNTPVVEINCSCGLLIQLVEWLCRRHKLVVPHMKLVCRGVESVIEVQNAKGKWNTLDFYIKQKLLSWSTFGQGCVAFATCVKELTAHLQHKVDNFGEENSINNAESSHQSRNQLDPSAGDVEKHFVTASHHHHSVEADEGDHSGAVTASHHHHSIEADEGDHSGAGGAWHDGEAPVPVAGVAVPQSAESDGGERSQDVHYDPTQQYMTQTRASLRSDGPPYRIEPPLVGGQSASVHYGVVSDEVWTKGMRNLVAVLQWCLKADALLLEPSVFVE